MRKTLFLSNSLTAIFLAALFYGCSINKAEVDDSLKKYFDAKQVEGCFTMLNNADGRIVVYNMGLDTMRLQPASTFKIINSLIALQTGVATDENMVIPWDGVRRWNKDWNKNLSMKEAFRVSAVPYYQEIARRIGKDTMQRWIDSLSYGNKNISGPIDSFWLNNTLKISPDEQLGLMKKLYFDQLPFRKSVMETVRNMMLQEDNTNYKLSYKTGWGYDEKGQSIGWVTGWIEENKHVYFFITLVRSDNKDIDMARVRLDITRDILKEYGFFEGKK